MQHLHKHALKLAFFSFCLIVIAIVGFARYQAQAAYSCTTAKHQDLILSGVGTQSTPSADLGNCGDPNDVAATSGAFDTITVQNLSPGQYSVQVQAEYNSDPDEYIVVTSSDGGSETILDLNGTNSTVQDLWGEIFIDMCQSSGGFVKIASYSSTGPQDLTVKQIRLTQTSATCGVRVTNGGNVNVVAGNTANGSVTATKISSATIGQLSWTNTGSLPSGVTLSINAPDCAPNCSSTTQFTTVSTLAPGSYPITIQGQSVIGSDICDSGWAYVRKITVNGSQVPAVQTSFPVLVNVTDAILRVKTSGGHVEQADGGDIYFALLDKTHLSHEIERYVSSTGDLVAWVKIPTLSTGSNTTFYMCYGNQGAVDQWNPTQVWDANYLGVWHLHNGPANGGLFTDSTINNRNGTLKDPLGISKSSVTGKIGRGIEFPAGNGSAFISLGKNAFGNPGDLLTIEAWLNRNTNNDRAIVSEWHWGVTGCAEFMFGMKNQYISVETPHETRWDGAVRPLAIGSWEDVAFVSDVNSSKMYVAGVEATSGERDWADECKEDVRIGANIAANGSPGNAFQGILDEIRVSKTARSASWLKTEYNNQNNPGGFYTLGTEESGVENTLTRTTTFNLIVTAPAQPDMAPSSITTPPSPIEGDSIQFTGDITNQGSAPTGGNSTAQFRMDLNNDGTFDSTISTHTVGSIATGNTVTVTSSSWTATAGTHRVEFCSDINGVIAESNEGNNCRTQIITVSLALPLSIDLTAQNTQVLRGKSTTITWVSQNGDNCTIDGPGISISGTCGSTPNACNGSAQTPPITDSSIYTFSCTASGNQQQTKTTTVTPSTLQLHEE